MGGLWIDSVIMSVASCSTSFQVNVVENQVFSAEGKVEGFS